jgi:hypothetical protein
MQRGHFIEPGLTHGVLLQAALLAACRWRGLWRRNGRFRHHGWCSRLRRGAKTTVMAVEHTGHRSAEVAEQMPPVGDLDGRGCSHPNPIGISASPVAGDDPDPGMCPQPGGHGLGPTIRQQLDRSPPLEVADDRAVSMTPPPCPIIDSDDARLRWADRRGCPDQAEQRIPAGRHGQPAGQACARLTAHAEADMPLDLGEPVGAPGMGRRNGWQALGKNPASAPGIRTAKAPNLEVQLDDAALPGKVAEVALISAVNPVRVLVAERAGRDRRSQMRCHGDEIGAGRNAVNDEPGRDQGKKRLGGQDRKPQGGSDISSICPSRPLCASRLHRERRWAIIGSPLTAWPSFNLWRTIWRRAPGHHCRSRYGRRLRAGKNGTRFWE